MFCRNCGMNMRDDATFCPACGTRVVNQQVPPQPIHQPTPQQQWQPGVQPGQSRVVTGPVDAKKILIKGAAAIGAVIYGILALLFLVRILDTVENTVDVFSTYDGIASALGTAGFVACGIVLAGMAALAASPLVRVLLEESAFSRGIMDRGIVTGGIFLVFCVAVWIGKLIFNSPSGGDVSSALYFIFETFGTTAVDCIIPALLAIGILYVARTKFMA